jgi:hypothetical protein
MIRNVHSVVYTVMGSEIMRRVMMGNLANKVLLKIHRIHRLLNQILKKYITYLLIDRRSPQVSLPVRGCDVI